MISQSNDSDCELTTTKNNSEEKRIWFQVEETSPYEYVMNILKEKNPNLFEKVKQSIEIIDKAFTIYKKPIALGYNGGKDSIVVVNLILLSLIKLSKCSPNHLLKENCLFFHFEIPNSFTEMDNFIKDSEELYDIPVKIIDITTKGFKKGLEELIESSESKLEAVFMGTRKIDPDGQNIQVFEKTSTGWPEMMRVSPILEWDYKDVWDFILLLNIPYCSLYDLGYTSLGSTKDTERNEALRQPNNSFLPAYYLLDGSLERAGRIKKNK
ncbi:hypothetical protein ABK040_008472 [Willaertia magna]